jgi:hypothetical protein
MAKIIPFPARSAVAGLSDKIDSVLRGFRGGSRSSRALFDLEESVSKAFDEAKREVLAQALQSVADETRDAEAVYVDGRRHTPVCLSVQEYLTSAGKVAVERMLFKDRSRASETSAFAPMDKELGILGDFWTPKAAQQALWMVTQMVPAKAAEAFERVGSMSPSKASLDRLPKQVSTQWESSRQEHEAALIASQKIPEGTSTFAVSLDGVYAPIEDEAENHVAKREAKQAQGLSARGPDAYREIGCASIAFYSASCELLGALRFGRAPEEKKAGVKKMLAAELAALVERHPSVDVVFLSDGARDHWEFFESLEIKGEHVLDFFHAAEHLSAALGAAYGDGSIKAGRRFAELRHILLEERGGVGAVERALVALSKRPSVSAHGKKLVSNAVRYVRRNAHRMQYARLKSKRLPIGSGVMEASCKTLVAQRMKLSGQRWTVPGAQAVLTARGWDQSDRFDEAFALLAATYEQEVTVFTPLRGALAASE